MRDEPLISFVVLEFRITRKPDFRAFLANGRNQNGPGILADRLRFLDPDAIYRLVGFNPRDVLAQAIESEFRPVKPLDRLSLHIVETGQAHRFDLIAQELQNRILDGVLEFTGAENP